VAVLAEFIGSHVECFLVSHSVSEFLSYW
jgi:hypothetical protein